MYLRVQKKKKRSNILTEHTPPPEDALSDRDVTIHQFSSVLNCPHCNSPVISKKNEKYDLKDWDNWEICSHVVFIFDEIDGFLKVRSDYGRDFIQRLISSKRYQAMTMESGNRALRNREVAEFGTGKFKSSDLVGIRVAEYLNNLPHISFPDLVPENSDIFETFYNVGKYYVGGVNKFRAIHICMNSQTVCSNQF